MTMRKWNVLFLHNKFSICSGMIFNGYLVLLLLEAKSKSDGEIRIAHPSSFHFTLLSKDMVKPILNRTMGWDDTVERFHGYIMCFVILAIFWTRYISAWT